MELAVHERGPAGPERQKSMGTWLYSVQRVDSRSHDRQLEVLWERHGRSLYALACTLLGDREAAIRAVTLGMSDVARSTDDLSADEALRSMARHVYRRSQELGTDTPVTWEVPPAMVWLGQLAQLQRACLALCLYGGHNHRQAAGLLGVPPMTVAEMLTAGLKEVGHLATGGTAPSA